MNGPASVPTERTDHIMPAPTDELKRAAREALDSHDALRATRATEPPSNEDGLPYDPDAWLTWREAVSEPAYARWHLAMDELARALDEPEMSRHPFNFRPRCEQILGERT